MYQKNKTQLYVGIIIMPASLEKRTFRRQKQLENDYVATIFQLTFIVYMLITYKG